MSKSFKILGGIILFTLCQISLAATLDPCQGSILSIFRRPTNMSSACTTPQGKYTFETGLSYLEFNNETHGLMYPQSKVRVGLPGRNELTIVIPNEMTNTKAVSGLTSSQLTFKHNVYYNENWNTALRAIFIPASGSQIYGTAHNGYTLNGILAYRAGTFNASVMLGYSSYSTSAASGGKRYNTLSPDVVIGWQAKEWLQLYAETFGQLKTAPNSGPGYNFDTGLLFLLSRNMQVDMEVGHRLSGQLGNYSVYYGAGFGVMF